MSKYQLIHRKDGIAYPPTNQSNELQFEDVCYIVRNFLNVPDSWDVVGNDAKVNAATFLCAIQNGIKEADIFS